MWVDPTIFPSGKLVDAVDWNIIVNDLIALKAHNHSGLAGDGARLYPPVGIPHMLFSNTAAVQNIVTETVLAGALGSNGFLYGVVWFQLLNSSGVNRIFTFTQNYGAAGTLAIPVTLTTSANPRLAKLEFTLTNIGAINSQLMLLQLRVGNALADNTAGSAVTLGDNQVWHATSELSNTDLAYSLTATMPAAAVTITTRVLGGYTIGPVTV
jgi:hypothetical protein